MFTMTAASRFARLSLGLSLALLCPALARAQDVVWPNTFNGQPEFSYSKKDLNTPQGQAAVGRGQLAEGDPVAALSVLIKRGMADPFAVQQPDILPDINLQGPRLNTLLDDSEAQLIAFKNAIDALVSRESVRDLSTHDFNADIGRVIIQSLVSSPAAYVMINNQRYTKGDAFTLYLPPQDETPRLRRLMNDKIPDTSTLPDEVAHEYARLRDDALAAYKRQLEAQNAGAGNHKVSVIIKDIEHRRLTLSILGKNYVLQLGAAL